MICVNRNVTRVVKRAFGFLMVEFIFDKAENMWKRICVTIIVDGYKRHSN